MFFCVLDDVFTDDMLHHPRWVITTTSCFTWHQGANGLADVLFYQLAVVFYSVLCDFLEDMCCESSFFFTLLFFSPVSFVEEGN